MLDERSVLIGLHEAAGIGWKRIYDILQQHADLRELPDWDAGRWRRLGMPDKVAQSLPAQLQEEYVRERLSLYHDKGITIITMMDEAYPILMKEIAQPPWVLYTIGKQELLSSFCIGMVGTRVPTAYGRKVAELLAGDMAERGITVVSGMARGIDSVCHEAVLQKHGHTIAVLGTGINVIYPPENRSLYHTIAERGLIISEYPIGTRSSPGLFPQRNRIIAGLSHGSVVVEADVRSGSLITADYAMDSNRDVFAVPGPVTSPKSQGTLALLKQGAILVTEANDITKEYDSILLNWCDKPYKKEENGHLDTVPEPSSTALSDISYLTEDEKTIYLILEQGDANIDELQVQSKFDFGLLHTVLLSLIIKKQIGQRSGAIYTLI
ncbi:DNA-processing protein DprA [Paenibacillus shenyangensis]|uniref:DNA-processing protein DprA n=1 Tax=Paenibacillus sp. A9 TaxID=1284352 RepID=UPI00038270DD|nr:DNA-processing protein DprA [Paenibacillus sp. A9]